MSDNGRLFSQRDFLSANPEKRLDATDYLHAVFQVGAIPSDVLLCFVKFFWPPFCVVDGRVFLSDKFDNEEYLERLADIESQNEVQFWLNLTEITGIFEA